MPSLKFSNTNYRYGFNGKENDPETGTQDYGMRIYDGRIAKFLSVDPLTKSYPELTPYQFSSNRPIDGIDLDGKERESYISSLIVKMYGVAALKIIGTDHGWGPVTKATYELITKSNLAGFNKLKEAYTTDPGIIHNKNNSLATYYPLENPKDDNNTLERGDHMYIDIAGPFNDYVRITQVVVTDYKFEITAATLFGHTDAGFIKFSGSIDPVTGVILFRIYNETTNNIGIDAATAGIGRWAQTTQWKTVLDNVEEYIDGTTYGKSVSKEISAQDAKKGDAVKVTHENLQYEEKTEEYKVKE